MRAKKSEQPDNNQLEGILVSYVFSNDDIEKNIENLRKYLSNKGINIETEKLRESVLDTKHVIESKKKTEKDNAILFTKDDNVREYKFGSGFCPKCQMFKNYDKECPYCSYLEIAWR